MILQTINQFIAAVPTAAGVENFDDLKPFVRSGELWLQNNVLGAPLYDYINTLSDSLTEESTPSPDNNAELIELCISVIANHAYWDAIPFLDVVHTNQGFAVISANNKLPASKERVERLRAQCLLRRDAEVENLLTFLGLHPEYDDYWKIDVVFLNMYNSLLPTLAIFREYHQIADRATLEKMQGAIITVQNTWVADVISKAFVDELVEAQKLGDFTSEHLAVLTMIRDAVCKLALAWGMESMSVIITTAGVVTLGTNDLNVGAIASDVHRQAYKTAFKKAGYTMLNRALDYMVKNIDDYDTFADSTEYAAMIAPGVENSTDSPIFNSIW